MKKRFVIILAPMIICLLIWGISLARCEILTSLHSNVFKRLCQENTMITPLKYLKVLSYSNTQARIYCVSEGNSMGNILAFTKIGEKWEYKEWENTVWSTSGTADNIIWPYWWHFFYSHKIV